MAQDMTSCTAKTFAAVQDEVTSAPERATHIQVVGLVCGSPDPASALSELQDLLDGGSHYIGKLRAALSFLEEYGQELLARDSLVDGEVANLTEVIRSAFDNFLNDGDDSITATAEILSSYTALHANFDSVEWASRMGDIFKVIDGWITKPESSRGETLAAIISGFCGREISISEDQASKIIEIAYRNDKERAKRKTFTSQVEIEGLSPKDISLVLRTAQFLFEDTRVESTSHPKVSNKSESRPPELNNSNGDITPDLFHLANSTHIEPSKLRTALSNDLNSLGTKNEILAYSLCQYLDGVIGITQADPQSIADEALKTDIYLEGITHNKALQIKSSQTGLRQFTQKYGDWIEISTSNGEVAGKIPPGRYRTPAVAVITNEDKIASLAELSRTSGFPVKHEVIRNLNALCRLGKIQTVFPCAATGTQRLSPMPEINSLLEFAAQLGLARFDSSQRGLVLSVEKVQNALRTLEHYGKA